MKETLPPFHFDFLGRCELRTPAGAVRLETAKTNALLVYLALSPAPQSRHRLAELMWGEQSEENANRSLRRALWDLRRKFNLPGLPPLIEADARQVRFAPGLCSTDVSELQTLAQRLEHTAPSALLPSDLEAAKALCQGAFLGNFSAGNATSFEEWAMLERERLHMLGLSVLENLAQGYIAQGNDLFALDAARGLLALDTWREESHRMVIRLLVKSGKRAAALAQFEQCRRILAEELGSEPDSQTVALYQTMQNGQPDSPNISVAPAWLPAQSTPFVGREREIEQIMGLMRSDDCHLLTISGPGGMGKTRLALKIGENFLNSDFRNLVFFVPLANVSGGAELLSAIAAALGLISPGSEISFDHAAGYLRQKRLLLILDNFEQLLAPALSEAAAHLVALIQTAPAVKFLVTSRERLNLRDEWGVTLEGLDLLPEHTPPTLTAPGSAVQLFINIARRISPELNLTGEDLAWVGQLCRQVEGLPLAIELAAGWVRALSCQEIAIEVQKGTHLLVSSLNDLPKRHRSLKAVFEQSWKLLSPNEQALFCQLSVFQNGFCRPAAERVAGATLPALANLLDKSLLRRSPDGRYQMHKQISQLAMAHLNQSPEMEVKVRDAHARYYASLMQECELFSRRNPQIWQVHEYQDELENFRAALQWSTKMREMESLGKLARGFYYLGHTLALYHQGIQIFTQLRSALNWLENQPDQADEQLAMKLAAYQASFEVYGDQAEPSVAVLEQSAHRFEKIPLPFETAECWFFCGEGARRYGNYEKARESYHHSLIRYQSITDRPGQALCLNGLGLVALAEKQFGEARKLLEESLANFQIAGQLFGQMLVGINLANLLKELGDIPTAQNLLESSLPICRNMHHHLGIATCLQRLGEIYLTTGQAERAQANFDEAAAIYRDLGLR